MKIYNQLLNIISNKGAAYLILLDPDKISIDKLSSFIPQCEKSGVDGFLIGGSLLLEGNFDEFIERIKILTSLPVIIFPGSVNQICQKADAILFLSVISGRNAEHLIGKHVIAAPIIKRTQIEPISTGYILVESGSLTTAQYMNGSQPIPRNKPEIAAATALAAEYLGMKLIYLEAGSGAEISVPNEMIKKVSEYCSVPLVVGGGIRDPKDAREKVENGAKIIVTGNYFEDENNWEIIKFFADAVHYKISVEV
ncbi:MAG: geranylgeranylglyceryl/heptaprenylglyceryl phosphate synthase [Ignavibacteriaceae bacterium]